MYVRVVRTTDVTPERMHALLKRIEEADGPSANMPTTGLFAFGSRNQTA